MVTIASTVPSSTVVFVVNALPITLKALASPSLADLASPLPAETSLSPLLTLPITLTGTLPDIAIAGCVSFDPADPFIKYAACVDITPNTASVKSCCATVISLHHLVHTVPAEYIVSASNVRQSAYCADVALACIV